MTWQSKREDHVTSARRARHGRSYAGMRDRLAAALWELRRLRRERQRLPAAINRIRAIVNDACCDAHQELMPQSREAINWGDLGCAEAGTKDDGYYVVIEEASPRAYELAQYVYERLAAAGFDNVDVTTEW